MSEEYYCSRLGYDLESEPEELREGIDEVLAVLEGILDMNHGPFADPSRYEGRKSPWG